MQAHTNKNKRGIRYLIVIIIEEKVLGRGLNYLKLFKGYLQSIGHMFLEFAKKNASLCLIFARSYPGDNTIYNNIIDVFY